MRGLLLVLMLWGAWYLSACAKEEDKCYPNMVREMRTIEACQKLRNCTLAPRHLERYEEFKRRCNKKPAN